MPETPRGPLKVAIAGSGPAGFYVADRLLRRDPTCRVTLLERLAAPFGLVRSGVAPDHHGTKAVVRIFDRLLDHERLAFFGNVEVGRDISVDELRRHFDAVVIATGAARDRKLNIPGETAAGIYGSGAFTGWYNGHPDHAGLCPALARVQSAVIIGNGNVALDVARILAKTPAEFEGSDLGRGPTTALTQTAITDIHIVGRRGPEDAKFSPQELAEFRGLVSAGVVIDPAELATEAAGDTAMIAELRYFAKAPRHQATLRVHFHFHARPRTFVQDQAGQVKAMVFEGAKGLLEIPAQLVVTCIGFEAADLPGLSATNGHLAHENGRIADGVYVTGWAGSGPAGTIASRRAESHALADRILSEVKPQNQSTPVAVERLLRGRVEPLIDAAAWRRIDAAEQASALPGRLREKFVSLDQMVTSGGRSLPTAL